MAESQKAGLAGWEGMGTSGNSRSHLGGTWLQVSSWPKVVTETLSTFPGRKKKRYNKEVKKAFDAQFIGRHNVIYERFSQHYQELEETAKSFRRVVQSCSGHFQRIYKRQHHCRPERQGILGYSFQFEPTLTLAKNKKATRVEKKQEDLEGRACKGGRSR